MEITGAIDYGFLRDAYSGGGGFLDGSYLYRHKREADADYALRRLMARYSNFVRVIVDSLVNPVFKKTIVRDYGESELMDSFLGDVDGAGTPMTAFMARAAKLAKLNGAAFIVCDNSRQVAASRAEAIASRQLPYAYLVEPSQVTAIAADRRGRLAELSYTVAERSGALGPAELRQWTWTPDAWRVKGDGLALEGDNPLGMVPAVRLAAGDSPEPLPVPDLLHIARANRDLYNRDSEKREILRNQCFPVLVYPASAAAWSELKRQEADCGGLSVGTNNMLIVDAEAGSPGFIAPPIAPIDALQREIELIIEDMFRQAGLTSVAAVRTSQSGVAKQWDFEQTTNLLADLAAKCEAAELALCRLCAAWANLDLDGLRVRYPREFGITDLDDELRKAAAMKELAVGGAIVNREVDRKAAAAYFADIDDARYDEAMAEIDAMPRELAAARAANAADSDDQGGSL